MNLPIAVIVGRPNVGKSTLFNRLLGKKEAIVDNISGVTRDRNFGVTDWNGKTFRLMDTGGYVPQSADLFETVIREQVEIAIEEADVLIFTVDGRDGIMPVDFEIAKMLRQSKKKVVLTVNKIDSDNYDAAGSEFYSLGLGEPYNISALNGRSIGDVLDIITEDFPTSGEIPAEEERLSIALVGRPNVGKSSLTNALLGYDRSIVTNIPGTTRDKINATLKYYGQEITLVDTAGLRKRGKVKESIEYFSSLRSLKAIGESTVTVLIIDAQEGFQNQDQKILDEAVRWRKGIILAVNKWDLVEKDNSTMKKFEEELREKMGNLDYVPIMFISALTKQRIYKLVDLALEIHAERRRKISTGELNDALLPIIEQTPPPTTHTGREVKIKYITQGGDYYPMFFFFTNYPKEIQDSYRRFLEKAIRRNFGFKGIPFTLLFKEK